MHTSIHARYSGILWGFFALCLTTALHAEQPNEAPGETRDVILMLDQGPLHLRIHVAIGGQSLPVAREDYVDRLIEAVDGNGDGKLTRDETSHSPLLRMKQRVAATAFLKSLGSVQTVSRRDIMRTVERVGGETIVYREDTASSDNDSELFNFLDQDRSGVLDRRELVEAAKRVLKKDSDRDEIVSFEELLPEPEPEPQLANGVLQIEPPPRPTASISTLLRDTRETLLARRLVKKYDRDRDRRLAPNELHWPAKRFRFLDTSRDRLLDEQELAFIHQTSVDLELAIDLAPVDAAMPAIQVLHVDGKRIETTDRPDFAKIEFNGAVVTFAHRHIDPIDESLENAMIEFNSMDGDANGYLEKAETEQRIRFARGLFESIDSDGDGKIFGEEMEEYVRVRGEPAATSCRVNIYDTGHGFFMALDSNGDGRIGVRERRESARSLALLDRDGEPGVSMREPVRHFHVEFVRGSYRMFGSMNESTTDTPAFQQRSEVGPIWFRRMDRNGDGDLVWSEFLGPRDAFHRLDEDHDGLIDPVEAVAAESFNRDSTRSELQGS
jgi:Ca2+-binding EF-hand superfamily protein